MPEYTTFDLCKAFDIAQGRMMQWVNGGFVKPSTPARGTGTKALFNQQAVNHLLLFKELVEHGINRNKASEFIDNLAAREGSGDPYPTDILLFVKSIKDETTKLLTLAPFKKGGTVSATWALDLVEGRLGQVSKTKDEKGVLKDIVFWLPTITKGIPSFESDWIIMFVINYGRLKQQAEEALSGLR